MTDPIPCERCGQPHAQCSSHRRDGQPCTQPPMRGQRVCRMHGGASGRAKAAAERRLQEQAAQAAVVTLGLPVDVSPTEALLEEVRWTAGHVQWLRDRVQELEERSDLESDEAHSLVWGTTKVKTGGDDHGTTQEAAPSIWYVLYERERKHLVTVCAAALKAGVEERRVRLAENQGALVADVIRRILDALNLTDQQRELVPTVVPAQLRLLAGGGEGR